MYSMRSYFFFRILFLETLPPTPLAHERARHRQSRITHTFPHLGFRRSRSSPITARINPSSSSPLRSRLTPQRPEGHVRLRPSYTSPLSLALSSPSSPPIPIALASPDPFTLTAFHQTPYQRGRPDTTALLSAHCPPPPRRQEAHSSRDRTLVTRKRPRLPFPAYPPPSLIPKG